jgi:tRNA(Ile)-lysidine synthase
MLPTPEALAAQVAGRFPAAALHVAYSGGLDSTVLLHLLQRSGVQPLVAVHVHHGLQPQADAWSEHCRRQAEAWAVPFRQCRVEVPAGDPAGPEAAARAARRGAFRSVMRAGDVLVTAHHREDQAETVLLRLMRGAGVDGLAAMREESTFGPGRQWRPLLAVPRSALRAYAEREGLRWVEDPHNADSRYARSWLRHAVVPLLRGRWPAVDEALARTAEHAADAAALLRGIAEADLAPLRVGAGLRIAGLTELNEPRRRNALRVWMRERGIDDLPSTQAMASIEREVFAAAEDAQPRFVLGGRELQRYRGVLYLLPRLAPAPGSCTLRWEGSATLELPADCGRLVARTPPPLPLQVSFPVGGERLCPDVAARTRSLKNLFQEASVPPWVRLRTPLLHAGGQLVAVADRWLAPEWRARCAEHEWSYRWLPSANCPWPDGGGV